MLIRALSVTLHPRPLPLHLIQWCVPNRRCPWRCCSTTSSRLRRRWSSTRRSRRRRASCATTSPATPSSPCSSRSAMSLLSWPAAEADGSGGARIRIWRTKLAKANRIVCARARTVRTDTVRTTILLPSYHGDGSLGGMPLLPSKGPESRSGLVSQPRLPARRAPSYKDWCHTVKSGHNCILQARLSSSCQFPGRRGQSYTGLCGHLCGDRPSSIPRTRPLLPTLLRPSPRCAAGPGLHRLPRPHRAPQRPLPGPRPPSPRSARCCGRSLTDARHAPLSRGNLPCAGPTFRSRVRGVPGFPERVTVTLVRAHRCWTRIGRGAWTARSSASRCASWCETRCTRAAVLRARSAGPKHSEADTRGDGQEPAQGVETVLRLSRWERPAHARRRR